MNEQKTIKERYNLYPIILFGILCILVVVLTLHFEDKDVKEVCWLQVRNNDVEIASFSLNIYEECSDIVVAKCEEIDYCFIYESDYVLDGQIFDEYNCICDPNKYFRLEGLK